MDASLPPEDRPTGSATEQAAASHRFLEFFATRISNSSTRWAFG